MIVDVSIHNGVIDWAKVKAAGVEGAIIRCGYGRDLTRQDDATFRRNIEGALGQGLRVGVYIYSYAKDATGARSEAAHILRLVEPYKNRITLPLYYDLEEANLSSVAKSNAIIFGDIIEAAGFWCGIYSSSYWWKTHLNGLNRFTKWVADWGVNNGKPNKQPTFSNTDLWQYTSKGSINGIPGRVDCNKLINPNIGGYRGAVQQIKPQTPEPVITPEPVKPQEPETRYISYKIVAGDTLSKLAKRYKTTVKAIKAANPDKIKNVNKIYAGDVIKIPVTS